MLEKTDDCVDLFTGNAWNTIYRRAKLLRWVPVEKEAEVDLASPAKTPSGVAMNRWTRHGMMSV